MIVNCEVCKQDFNGSSRNCRFCHDALCKMRGQGIVDDEISVRAAAKKVRNAYYFQVPVTPVELFFFRGSV